MAQISVPLSRVSSNSQDDGTHNCAKSYEKGGGIFGRFIGVFSQIDYGR